MASNFKQATFINHTAESFTKWPGEYGYKAIDVADGKLLKQWDTDEDIQQIEMDLNKMGYTLGLRGVVNG